jgi:tetratricopeptide (TPR) repeat protein
MRKMWALAVVFSAAAAGQALTVRPLGPSGEALPEVTGVFLTSANYLLVPRSALFGATRAEVLGPAGQRWAALDLAAESRDLDLALLYVQLHPEPVPVAYVLSGVPDPQSRLTLAGHAVTVAEAREIPAFCAVMRTTTTPEGRRTNGPILDPAGRLAAWGVSRVVDGETFLFALPTAAVSSLAPGYMLTLEAWSSELDLVRERGYLQASGYMMMEDHEGAGFYWKKYIELRPSDAYGWLHYGYALGKLGRGKEKLAAYYKAESLGPEIAAAHYQLGFSLVILGDATGARGEVEHVRRLDPLLAAKLEHWINIIHHDPLPLKPLQLPTGPSAKLPSGPQQK